MNFCIKSHELDGVHILELVGKLTIGSAVREFKQAMDRHISNQTSCILINCSQLTFMDSSGIGELVGSNTKARDLGIRLMLCELSQKVRDLFRITQVSRLFSIYESESAALEAYEAEQANAVSAKQG